MLRAIPGSAPACPYLSIWHNLEFCDSNPIHTHDTPSSTNSFIEYLRIAFAEANTAMPQLLRAAFIRSSSAMARSRCNRKFSSITKKVWTFMDYSKPVHQLKQLVAGLVKIVEISFAAEK